MGVFKNLKVDGDPPQAVSHDGKCPFCGEPLAKAVTPFPHWETGQITMRPGAHAHLLVCAKAPESRACPGCGNYNLSIFEPKCKAGHKIGTVPGGTVVVNHKCGSWRKRDE